MKNDPIEELKRQQKAIHRAMINPAMEALKMADFSQQQIKFQLESPISKIIQQQREFSDLIGNPVSKFFEEQREIFNMLEGPLKQWREQQRSWKSSITNVFDQMNFHKDIINTAFGQVPELLRKAKDNFEKYKELMIILNFPPHHDMDFRNFRDIYDFYLENGEEGVKDKIFQLILENFSDKIVSGYYKNWIEVEWLQDRIPILEESILNYLDERYYSAISTLLPQIEGIIIERGSVTGYVSQRELKRMGERLLDETGDFSLDDAVRMFYVGCILDSFEHGQSISSPLSRHAILHGADTKYGYKLNALRCILFFDYLISKLISDISTEQ